MTGKDELIRRVWHPDFPYAPGKWPFFDGWMIAVAGTIGMIMSIPGQTMGVSVFTEPLMEVLGLTRVQLSAAYMIGTIASGFLMPWGGRLYDRFGARPMVVFSSLLLGINLVYLSQCDRIAGRMTAALGPDFQVAVSFATILVGFWGKGC